MVLSGVVGEAVGGGQIVAPAPRSVEFDALRRQTECTNNHVMDVPFRGKCFLEYVRGRCTTFHRFFACHWILRWVEYVRCLTLPN